MKPIAGRIGEDNVRIINNSSDDIFVKKKAIITEVVDNQAATKRHRIRTNLRIREVKRRTINTSDDIILKKPAAATKKKDVIFKKPAETETETETPAANSLWEPWTKDGFPRRRPLHKRPAIRNSPDSNDHDQAANYVEQTMRPRQYQMTFAVPHYDGSWPVPNYGEQINLNAFNIAQAWSTSARSTADGSLPHNEDDKSFLEAHGADPNQLNPDSNAIGDANSDAASRSD